MSDYAYANPTCADYHLKTKLVMYYWFVKKALSHFFNAKDAKVSQSAQRNLSLNFAVFGSRCENFF